MGGYSFALVEDLDRLFVRPDGHFFAGQGVGNIVEMFAVTFSAVLNQ